jgi:hypothetical protein
MNLQLLSLFLEVLQPGPDRQTEFPSAPSVNILSNRAIAVILDMRYKVLIIEHADKQLTLQESVSPYP